MTSSFTPNVGLEKPANGDDVDTWDVPVNGNSDFIDSIFGATTTFNLVAASGIVAVTATQYRPRIWKATGALTANVNLQLPSGVGGTWSIGNTTTGAFTLTISSAGAGTSVVVTQGSRALVSCDGTNVFLSDTSSSVPIGMIALWSGSVATIPTGWHLCDGTAGTVNLRDKFIVGAGSTYAVGATGGTASQTTTVSVLGHALLTNELALHSHGVFDPGHAHGVSDPSHLHTLPATLWSNDAGSNFVPASGTGFYNQNLGGRTTDLATTGITINNATTGVSTLPVGNSDPHTHGSSVNSWDNRPPYYALAYIQKIS